MQAAPRLDWLHVKALRGIVDSQLRFGGKSVVLVGENGTGKSSFVDGLELLLTHRISHLEGTQGLSAAKHAPHVRFSAGDTRVAASFRPNDLIIDCSLTAASDIHENLRAYVETAQQGVCILRRTSVLEFIISQPADRYRAIGAIIGVASLDGVELEMKRARDDFKSSLETGRNDVRRLFSEISTITGNSVSTQDSILIALNKYLVERGLAQVARVTDSQTIAESLLKNVKKEAQSSETQSLVWLSKSDSSISILNELEIQVTNLHVRITEFLKHEPKFKLSQFDLLERGRDFISEAHPELCPICEQPIVSEQVLPQIDERLSLLQSLSAQATELRMAAKSVASLANQLKSSLAETSLYAGKVLRLSQYQQDIEISHSFADAIAGSVEALGEFGSLLRQDTILTSISFMKSQTLELVSQAKQLLLESELSQADRDTLSTINDLNTIKRATEKSEQLTSTIKILEIQSASSESIYENFTKTKNSAIQQIYDTIQTDVRSYYEILHPNEPHENVQLSVNVAKRASTDLKIRSFGREGDDPRAFCSEGHLDSLGLCIFLAFVKKFNIGCSLVVLDDVVTTIDRGHRQRICDLLFGQFREKQFFVTTHDRVWARQLQEAAAPWGIQNDYSFQQINNWSVSTGPSITPFLTPWQTINDRIARGDFAGLANLGRQYTERVLFQICQRTEARLKIPLVQNQYDLKDLFDTGRSRINKLVADANYASDFDAAMKALESTVFMGNVASHNNPLADELSPSEIESFCRAARNIELQFSCGCGNLLYLDAAHNRLICSGKTCEVPRIVPTKKN